MKILVLHNIRSAQNVGAMFRTSEAIGIDQIILSGYTATPTDRFGRESTKVSKASLGAQNMVDWIQSKDILITLKELQQDGYNIVAIEQSDASIDYKTYNPSDKEVIIMGNEVTGVEQDVLRMANTVLELPMRGEKESLNVSTACGIVLFRLFDN